MTRPPIDGSRGSSRDKGWVHTHGAGLIDLLRTFDAATILATLWLSAYWIGWRWEDGYLLVGLAAIGLFTTTAGQWTLYRSWRVTRVGEELRQLVWCWLAAMLILTAGLYMLDTHLVLPRRLVVLWAALGLVVMVLLRVVVRNLLYMLRRRGANFRVAAIAGANETGARIAASIEASPWMGLRLAGYYDDRTIETPGRTSGLPLAGGLNDLAREVAAGRIDMVYIALPLRAELRTTGLVEKLRDSTATVMYVPDFSGFGLLHSRWEVLAGMPMISLIDTPHLGTAAVAKRLFDLVIGSVILLLIAIPMLVIAVCIRLDSPGPVLFRQKRYGLDGREFEIYKFRSMRVVEDGRNQFTQATRNDPRVTPLGAFLRRTSLDELPQFINVLQGRMSIIGPRPHPVALNETQRRLIDGYMLRHKVLPGITGWAQVNGCRGETDTPEKMVNRIRYDLDYIDRWSLWLDLRILGMTILKGFVDKNAY